jgi:hypothetical protein
MLRLRRTLVAAAALAAVLLTTAPPGARATTVVALSDADLARGARTIVHADVAEKRSFLHAPSGRIFTEYRFALRELLKGEESARGSVVFREWGGEVGGVRYWIPGVDGYEPGEEVVAFLGEEDARTGVGFTFGLAQGKFRVERDAASGEARLTRRLGALELLPPPTPPGAAAPLAPRDAARDLDLFKTFVRAEVRK